MKSGRLRIIAGSLRGRFLEMAAGREVRPTGNRVREALFSRLGDLTGRCVLDLYAGSGALGIEALSRGARRATFVDCAPKAIALLKKNLQTLGLTEDSEIFLGEALSVLPRLGREARQFDLVFLDPPYASDELQQVLPALAIAGVLAPNAEVVMESACKAALSRPGAPRAPREPKPEGARDVLRESTRERRRSKQGALAMPMEQAAENRVQEVAIEVPAEFSIADSHEYGDTRLTRLYFESAPMNDDTEMS